MGTRAEGRLSWCYCWGRQCWKGGHSATLSCDHCLQQSWGSVRLWATLGRCHITVIPLQLPKLWYGVLAPPA